MERWQGWGGPAHCRERVQDSVWISSASVQQGISHSGGLRAGSGNGTRSRYSLEEGGHCGGPSSWQRVRVPQPLRHRSEEGWRLASNSRYNTTELLSHETQVQDAYVSQIRSEDCFHISILPQHRKFLRFAFRGKAYQYWVLPFGLALSPCTFTNCVDAALAPLRFQGIRILNYIDDWLILAQSEQLAVWHWDAVLAHMKDLGLRLEPCTGLKYTFTFMHLADAFIQSDLQLHSGYSFSLVHVIPGNRTHNLLRCWLNALPLWNYQPEPDPSPCFFFFLLPKQLILYCFSN